MVFQFFVKPVHIRASVFASVSTSTSTSASTRGRSFTNVNTVLSQQRQQRHLQPQKSSSLRHSITTSSASTLTSVSFPSSYSSLFNQTITKNHKNSDTVGNSGIRINSSSVGSSVSFGNASYLGDLQNQSLRFMSSTSTSNDDDNDNDNNNDNNNNHDSKNNNDINNNNNNNNINDVNKTQDTNDIPNHNPTNNDIPNHHPTNKMNKTISKQKLNDLLSELGMSISQWNIVKNMNFNTDANHNNIRNSNSNNNSNSSSKSNTKRKSRRRERQNTRRVSEEFDTYYNHPNVSSSMPSSSSMSQNKYYKNGFGSSSLLSESVTSRLRVRSVHLAHTIDVTSVLSKIFGPMSAMPSMKHMFGKTSVIVQLPPIHDKNDTSSSSSSSSKSNNGNNNDHDSYFHPQAQPRFIAIFRFGSIVFFNVPTKDAASILKKVKKYSTDPISTSFERKEHFEVAISPFMEQDAHVTSDFALVKELNINNVAVISTIMAQTVAFDSYNDLVDELLSTFDDINSTVKKTGNFTSMQKETLFKVVAQNNSLFIDMIAKLGIKDRSDTAWNMSQYERIHEEMKQEFEIEGRFEHIEFKLNLIQQNAKFFLEVLHNQKSDTLEWIIIVLIGFECILMILDMSGMGQKLLTLIPS